MRQRMEKLLRAAPTKDRPIVATVVAKARGSMAKRPHGRVPMPARLLLPRKTIVRSVVSGRHLQLPLLASPDLIGGGKTSFPGPSGRGE